MHILHKFLVAAILTAVSIAQTSEAADYPLKISQDGRTIVDQSGTPFFINGDTAWSLIGQVSKEDAELYLKDCAEKGINSVVVTLVEGHYADNAPANFYGVQPFLSPGKLRTPNEEYFAHADWVISKAAEYGIQLVIAPLYLGCCSDGWLSDLQTKNSEADARWYGRWIGDRYKNFPNLIYVWGNDMNPGNVRSKIRAMAEGVKARDPAHLQTFHAAPENSALDQWSASETWLDINVTYTYEPVQNKSLQDYNRQPYLPYFLFESQYERDFYNADAHQTRKQAYVAVLSGAGGHHYGNNPLWHMNGRPGDSGNTWKNHLDAPGRSQLVHVRRLFESRDWHELVPDQAHSVVTNGFGTGDNFVAAAMTSDRETAIVYFPGNRPVTFNFDAVAGQDKQAWWYDPRNGSVAELSLANRKGLQSISPPTNQDWLLVVDDADSGLPPPGSVSDAKTPEPPRNLRTIGG